MKKLIILMFLMIFLGGSVSAAEWDNVKSYNEETKTITVVNALGLGNDIATIQLQTPLDIKVGQGYNKVAQFKVSAFDDYNNAFKELELFDKRRGMNKFTRDFDFKLLSYETIIVNDWGNVYVGVSINGTDEYRSEVIGTHEEQREVWTKLTPADFKKNDELIIAIFTSVEAGDKVEWIPNMFGVRIDEWASWTEAMDVGLLSYYRFDGDVTDNLGNNNGVDEGTADTISGIINNARFYDGSADVDIGDFQTGSWDNFTFNAWINYTGNDQDRIMGKFWDGTLRSFDWYTEYSASCAGNMAFSASFNGENNAIVYCANSAPTPNQMSMVTVTYKDPDLRLYIDGLNVGNFTKAGGLDDNSIAARWGRDNFNGGGTAFITGIIDEGSIHIRELTGDEVFENLWNDGNGNQNIVPTGPTITLNAPIDAFNSTIPTINFNASINSTDDSLGNVTLYIDDILNETNSSGINDVNYLFTKILSKTSHNWTIESCDDIGCGNSTTRTLTINTLAPNVTLNLPNNSLRTNSSNVNFNATVFDNEVLVNVSLYISGILNETNSSGINNTLYNFNKSFSDGERNWTIEACDNFNTCTLADPRNFTVHTTPSVIEVFEPNGTIDIFNVGDNLTLSWNISEEGENLTEHIQSCSYVYNSIETQLNQTQCIVLNQTSFLYVEGIDSLVFKVLEEFNITTTKQTNWNFQILVINQTYNNETTETSIEDFDVWINYSASDWNTISANLNYAGTNYSAIQVGVGNTIMFNRELEVPLSGTEINNTFYWIFSLVNSTDTIILESNENNQTVSNVSISINCGAGDVPYLRFDTKNAENPFPDLNATFKSAWDIKILGEGTTSTNFSFEDITETNNTWEFCISPNSSNYTISVDVEVDATEFAKNFYYITEANYISDETSNISLYLLNDTLASPTILRVSNKATTRLANVLISIQLYDIGTDIFYTIGMAKTNENGEDVVYLNWFDSLYKFILVQNGETILITNTTKIFETPKLFEIDTDLTFSYSKFRDFQYTLIYNNLTNNFVLTFVKPSALVEQGCLRTIKRTSTADEEICETCTESASATLYCNIASAGNGTFISTFYATGSLAVIDWISESIGLSISEEINQLLDQDDAAFYTIMFALLIVVMFAFSPIFGILGLIMGLLGASVLGFTVIQYQTFLGIAIIGGGIMWLIKR